MNEQARVKLSGEEFFQMLAKSQRVTIARLEAKLVAAAVRQAQVDSDDLFAALGVKYGFDPKQNYTFDEAACELVAV